VKPYLRGFFDFLRLGFLKCGAGGVFSIRRSTSSGFIGLAFMAIGVCAVAETKSITPKMIEAGIRSYLSWDHREDDPGQIVAEIFAEMDRARVQVLGPSGVSRKCKPQ